MKYPCKSLALALALALALGSGHGLAAAADDAALARLLNGSRLDVAATDRIYRHALLSDAGVDGLYRRLDAISQSDAASGERAMALLARAYMQWRQGDGAQALAAVEQALALAHGVDACLLKARLLDARGDTAAAADWYRQALAGSQDPAEQELLRLRLALLDGSDPAAALSALARQRPQPYRNRAAVVLALLGQPQQALALYQVDAQAGDAYAQQVRAAGWAIAAGQHAVAREYAWAAFGHAGNAIDQRYALALLMESYRSEGTLAAAIGFLQAQPPRPELEQATVDALLELQRYDAAIALVRGSRNPELRQRLPGILELAGRRQDLAAEYRQLIAQQPHRLEWYGGLAALYMAEGDEAQALAVYRQAFAGNRGRTGVLVAAARQMAAMGLQEQALELLGSAGDAPSLAIETGFFRFDTLLAQGQDAQAAQALRELQRRVAADDPLLVEIADGYERLQQPQQALEVLLGLERHRRQALDYDLQVRIADLALKTGRAEQSLARWRILWAQARLPARRSYLERQIVKVARSLGRLDELADGLEAQLARGEVQRSGLDLLVAVALAQDDRARAEAAVTRYAGAGSADRVQGLQQLADLYARLGDAPRFEQTLRRLVQADPENAELYLRRLALSTLRQSPRSAVDEPESVQVQRVEQLLAGLQPGAGHDSVEDNRFAAGVYAMAGLDDQAIAGYRRALALAPDDADSLLQVADLLGRRQRGGEAATMLQYVADSAAEQKTFALAIDALAGVFAAEPVNPRRGDDRAQSAGRVLGWAQRRVMERIVSGGDDYPLYALLADLGQQQADFGLQLRAYDNSLALAGEQRPLILRQLVTLASGSTDAGAGPAIGDNRRKLVYGRRLIALKRQFPPDFYADLGRSLLAEGDQLGAERAFAAMTDIGGLVDIAQVKGDAYAGEGYVDQALVNYSQALARDQDNLGLVLKTSILLEQRGQPAQANHWYWHALRMLVLRQPLQDNGLVIDGGLDAQRYYPSLLEGLLLTWPDSVAAQRQVLDPLQQMFDQAMAQAGTDGGEHDLPSDADAILARHLRLQLILSMSRRIAEYRQDFAQVDAFEAAVSARFGNDPQQRADTAYYRQLTGRAEPAPAASTDWVTQGLAAQAGIGGQASNVGLALAVAAASEDGAQVGALIEAALAAEAEWKNAHGRDPQAADPGPDTLYLLIVQGMNRLPRGMFLELLFKPLDASPFRDEVLFNLYRGAPGSYRQLERLVGAPLLQDDTLIQLLVERGNDPLPYLADRHARGGADGGGPEELTARFGADRQITLYERFGARAAEGKGRSALQHTLVLQLLKQPLDARQQARLAQALDRDMDSPSEGQDGSAAFFLDNLLVLDCDPGNRQLLVAAARRLGRRYRDAAHLEDFLAGYFAGDREAAYRQLLALYADTGDAGGNYAAPIIRRFFPEQRQRRAERFLAAAAPSDAEIAEFHREFVVASAEDPGKPDQATLVRYYQKLVEVAPDNAAFQAGLLDLRLRQRDYPAFNRQLQAYVARNPGDREAATLLALGYRLQGQPQQALEVQQASGVDVDAAAWMVQMLNKANAPRQGAEPDFGRLFLQVYGDYEAARPDAAVVQAVAAQRRIDRQRADGGIELQPLAESFAAAPDGAAAVLRGLWRNASEEERRKLLDTRFDLHGRPQADDDGGQVPPRDEARPAGGEDLLAAMAASPAVGREYEAYLRGLPPQQRQRQQRLYALLAQSLQDQGQAQPRMAQLLGELAARTIGGHDLQLLATLAVRSRTPLDGGQLQALVARLRQMPMLSPDQRALYAQLFAAAGDDGTAAQLLDAAVLQVLYPDASGSPGYDPGLRPQATIAGIIDSLGQWRDRAAARRVHARLLRRIDQERASSRVRLPDLPAPAWLDDRHG
ncbi:hypothetical protein [Stenotrophomonas sp. MMGLT7]|uniref:hypothetical protein n=1 Tax=Stenotrophomonas sp. MMGLT7 TaxID=2901227 RepID=UPI001E2B1564|nr:hypothetical protein [Stenotrophomonas sp. MMGLT7]MCD7099520.1 hypothetical protein [Stenotrophomonas sp. MMGLT7]